MHMIKFMVKQFLKEPIWFKLLITSTLLISIIFSSSIFSDHVYFQSLSKLAAAIFFVAYGIKLRRNSITSTILLTAAGICILLSLYSIYKALS